MLQARGKKNLTKEEIEQRKAEEIEFPSDEIIAPEYLLARMKREFYKYAKQLKEIGIIGNVDADLLAKYVMSEDQYRTVSREILRLDMVKDLKTYTSLVTAQNKLFTQCRQAGSDLGLSITSRGKLVVPKGDEEDKEQTPEEKLFGNAL